MWVFWVQVSKWQYKAHSVFISIQNLGRKWTVYCNQLNALDWETHYFPIKFLSGNKSFAQTIYSFEFHLIVFLLSLNSTKNSNELYRCRCGMWLDIVVSFMYFGSSYQIWHLNWVHESFRIFHWQMNYIFRKWNEKWKKIEISLVMSNCYGVVASVISIMKKTKESCTSLTPIQLVDLFSADGKSGVVYILDL